MLLLVTLGVLSSDIKGTHFSHTLSGGNGPGPIGQTTTQQLIEDLGDNIKNAGAIRALIERGIEAIPLLITALDNLAAGLNTRNGAALALGNLLITNQTRELREDVVSALGRASSRVSPNDSYGVVRDLAQWAFRVSSIKPI